ncbi:universal stress protein [Granulosicoccaceae sp. 1_MG-2023]|nr:universal stress protein [Granulosicoccaceae sp. 1_MG-2023]
MYEKILIATDGSAGSMKALQHAIALQKLCGAQLLILSVFRHYSQMENSISMVRPREPEHLDQVMREYARELAEQAKQVALEAGCAGVRAFVKSGSAGRGIARFAVEHEADLIVVGSHGAGDVSGFLLGSVAHKVTSIAPCPVLVV